MLNYEFKRKLMLFPYSTLLALIKPADIKFRSSSNLGDLYLLFECKLFIFSKENK